MDRFVGKRIDGRYEIQEIIGIGGMAVVYKARDNQENRTVAVKILKEEFTSNEEFLRRFKNESKAIAMLSHPNIVDVYDVSFGDLIQYIVMEYIDGITLKEFIEREGSLRWKDAVHFTVQILKGLQHAHDKGIVHRDVKPQNIMVLPDGTIKVTDFGIARFARSDQRTITDKAIGSVHYISPEQARGEKTDEKADVYSVGVMLYEMLTGKLPFQADSAVSVAIMQLQRDPQLPTEINGSIPLGLEQITMHAMQKTVERRYQSAAEMLCDLVSFRKDPALTFEYSYFVDNSPTRYVGDIPVVTPIPENAEQNFEATEEEETKTKSMMVPILAGIATTLAVAVIIVLIIVVYNFLQPSAEEYSCHNFVGMTWEEDFENGNFDDRYNFVIKWEYNDDCEYGEVFRQSITPGEKLKDVTKITLYVSLGKDRIQLPDFYNTDYLEAQKALRDDGFTVKIEKIDDDTVEPGFVVRTEPEAYTTVAKGSEITLFVCKGAIEKKAIVPNVINWRKQKAIDALEDKEGGGENAFNVVIEEVYLDITNAQQPLDYVIDQESAEEELPVGTSIKIFVTTGWQFDVTIDFSRVSSITTETGEIELFNGSNVVEGYGGKILLNEPYTFEGIKTKSQNSEYSVYLSGKKICTIKATVGYEPSVVYY